VISFSFFVIAYRFCNILKNGIIGAFEVMGSLDTSPTQNITQYVHRDELFVKKTGTDQYADEAMGRH
jgi:hypothetical protein